MYFDRQIKLNAKESAYLRFSSQRREWLKSSNFARQVHKGYKYNTQHQKTSPARHLNTRRRHKAWKKSNLQKQRTKLISQHWKNESYRRHFIVYMCQTCLWFLLKDLSCIILVVLQEFMSHLLSLNPQWATLPPLEECLFEVHIRYTSWKGTKNVLPWCFQSCIMSRNLWLSQPEAGAFSIYMHRQRCRACWTIYGCKRGADHSPSSTDHDAVCKSPPLSQNCRSAEPCHWCYPVH